jgi:hypothetical protein
LKSAEIVTADGRVVTANTEENPDLFWGIRGGGENFAIAASFEFNWAEIGTEVFSGLIVKNLKMQLSTCDFTAIMCGICPTR